MADGTTPSTRPEEPLASGDLPMRPPDLMSELGTLLSELEHVSTATAVLPPVVDSQTDNQLVQVRLGIANSLYAALRLKHAATAGHGLRVALTSSAWALEMGLSEKHRDVIEVAALLHDVGMIGVPDEILLKPGPLDAKEARIIRRARGMSLEVLRCACAEPAILEITEHVGAWYDGTRPEYHRQGNRLPLGARMITIAEAFDAMTTDHVFRPAMSVEHATRELFAFAGSQFDPKLVAEFVQRHAGHQSQFHQEAAARWLQSLDPEVANSFWALNAALSTSRSMDPDGTFPDRLLDNMHDAVVFIEASLRVARWNHGAERLTGISGLSIRGHQWLPDLLKMHDEKGNPIHQDDCPVSGAIRSGVQSLRRLSICGRNGRPVTVDSHAIPVAADDGTTLGAILLLHDASSEASLEERCQSLHEKATRDALTQVANRAEFDRVHEAFIKTHKQQQVPCSLIICDLDRFKQINDTYGHPAGDEAIKTMARLLKSACRPGDLVARYGGEEFVILCADCGNASAARRADQLRTALAQTPQMNLQGRALTASFGVTEIQPGDTPDTMLRRADRALLMAKAKGRNRVVQLGIGSGMDEPQEKRQWFWRKPSSPGLLLAQDMVTPVPITMAIEKLRGFVADHRAKIVAIRGNRVQLEIDDRAGEFRRSGDRPVAFSIDLRLEDEQVAGLGTGNAPAQTRSQTRIHVTVRPRKSRDRRRTDIAARAREVLASVRSYLMATVEKAPPSEGVVRRVRRTLLPWLKR